MPFLLLYSLLENIEQSISIRAHIIVEINSAPCKRHRTSSNGGDTGRLLCKAAAAAIVDDDDDGV